MICVCLASCMLGQAALLFLFMALWTLILALLRNRMEALSLTPPHVHPRSWGSHSSSKGRKDGAGLCSHILLTAYRVSLSLQSGTQGDQGPLRASAFTTTGSASGLFLSGAFHVLRAGL